MRVDARVSLEGAFVATGFPFRAQARLDEYLEVFRAVFLQVRGLRRCGAAALDLAHCAAGIYGGFFEFGLETWDVAAGSLLIEEAGGVVTDTEGGSSHLQTGNIVGGGPGVHRGLLACLSGAGAEAGRIARN